MIYIYSLSLQLYQFAIRIASLFNPKARSWVKGRAGWRKRLSELLKDSDQVIWFHAASLGEAEQGLPVIEKLKKQKPQFKVLLTFFSPSGFENFNGNEAVDFSFYLPIDSKSNARDFIRIVNPKMAVFIKYEIWVHYFKQLAASQIPFYLTSALFRDNQVYFKKPYSKFFLPVLNKVKHIMVQNEPSKTLLEKHGLKRVSVCGETRIDRVLDLLNSKFNDAVIENFVADHKVLIAGSSWPIEEAMIKGAMDVLKGVKIILAPHDIGTPHISGIQKEFSNYATCLYSEGVENTKDKNILIIDNIGLLSRIYRFADVAFIGGGFGKGLHSTIEAAVYGLPVLFGPNHTSFLEPSEMKAAEAGFEITDQEQFEKVLFQLLNDEDYFQKRSEAAKSFVAAKAGAVDHILTKLQSAF